MSRHPDLNTYIATVLLNSKPLLRAGAVDRLVCAIIGPRGNPLEYYVFQVHRLGTCGGGGGDDIDGDGHLNEDKLIFSIESQLRDLLLRTMALEWQCGDLPKGCRFTILVHTRDLATDEGGSAATRGALSSGTWLLAQEHESGVATAPGLIAPLRSIAFAGMDFQLFVVAAPAASPSPALQGTTAGC